MVRDGKLLAYDGKQWNEAGKATTAVESNSLVVTIARKDLKLKGKSLCFDFKWADNPANLDSPIGLATGGDTAPNRRFNYRFVWNK